MNLIQLITFAWVGTWVLAESLFPSLSYSEKMHASLLSVFVAAYANNAHGVILGKWKKIMKRK